MIARLPGPDTSTKAAAVEYAKKDPRFAAMLAQSAAYRWPVGFQDDLYVHDLNLVRDCPDLEFVWILREMGSHLYLVDDWCKGSRDWARGVCDYYSGTSKSNYGDTRRRFFYVRRTGDIKEVTCDEAKALVSRVPEEVTA